MNHRQPANILYVSHTADLRGSAMSLRELLLNLDAQRFVPHVLLSKHGPFEEILAAAKVPCTVLTQRGFLNIWRIKQARDYMLKHQIALVHLNSAVPFCRDVGIAAHFAGIPVVWHIREDPEGKRVRRWSKWIRWLSDRIVVVSSDLEEHFKTTGKVVKIYNGVNLQRFSPQGNDGGWRKQLGIADDEFIFVVVGTIEERKGQHLIVEAADSLIELGRPFRIIFVGTAMIPEDQQRLESTLARYPQVAKITHCIGRQADIPPILRSSSCLMLPSTWEGFPRTVAEGMACGLPVIATPVGEVPAMVREGVNGLLVPPCDVHALRVAMRNMMLEDIVALGRNAYEHAQQWSTQAHIEAVSSIYDEILQATESLGPPDNVAHTS